MPLSPKILVFIAVFLGSAVLTTIVDRLSGFKYEGKKRPLIIHNVCVQLTGFALMGALMYADIL